MAVRYPPEHVEQPLAFGFALLGGGGSLLAALWMIASPWPLKRITFRSILFVSLVYAGILFSAFAQKLVGTPATGMDALQLAITTLSFQGAVLVLVGRLIREHDLNWFQAFGFNLRWPLAVGIGFMAAFSMLPIAWGLQTASAYVMTWLNFDPEVQTAVNIFNLTEAWSDRIVLGMVALILAPVAEELLFRGVLYPALKGFGLPRFAFWSTAIVFSLIHFNVATFLPLFVFACLLNVLYERTGNLLTCIVAHSTFNALNLIMLLVVKHITDSPALP